MNRFKLLALSAMLALGFGSAAHAATATTNFQVNITITNACDAASLAATDVNFGSHSFLDSNIVASSNLSVKCTTGAAYKIALNAGANASAPGDTTTRRMTDGTNFVPYNLFSDSAYSASWGDTDATGQVAATGTGAVQTFPIYGKALPGNVPAGNYSDTVQATVTY